MNYTTVINCRVKFTRRLDNRRVIQCCGRYHDRSIIVVVSIYYTMVHTIVESRNIVANTAKLKTLHDGFEPNRRVMAHITRRFRSKTVM